jgi:hypothetical protein
MKHNPNHMNNAKAVIALLVLAIAFVIFYKFITNTKYLYMDPNAMQNYVIFAIVGGGFLIGLLYLTSQATHKPATKVKSVKSSTKSKKKKK